MTQIVPPVTRIAPHFFRFPDLSFYILVFRTRLCRVSFTCTA